MKKPEGAIAHWWSDEKGFAAVLLLCLCAVGVAAWILFASPQTAETDPLDGYVYEADDSITTSDPVEGVPAMDATSDSEEPAKEEPTLTEPTPAEQTSEVPTEEPIETLAEQIFVPPMTTSVSRKCSGDTLEYDETTKDWRTHNGTDYTGQAGDAVCAVTDGTVTEVGENAIYGKYVKLSHANEMLSLYAGLDEISVKEGDSISGGKQLAVLGEPMPLEQTQGTHLHLEVTKDGKFTDAETLFG